jgi:hypothetical protein
MVVEGRMSLARWPPNEKVERGSYVGGDGSFNGRRSTSDRPIEAGLDGASESFRTNPEILLIHAADVGLDLYSQADVEREA